MSKFTTTIPVDVQAVKDSLPKQSHIHRTHISADGHSLVLEWENDEWRTPYTVNMEVSPDALAGKEPLPDYVKTPEMRAKAAEADAECKRVQNEDVAPTAEAKAKKKRAKTAGQSTAEPGDQAGG